MAILSIIGTTIDSSPDWTEFKKYLNGTYSRLDWTWAEDTATYTVIAPVSSMFRLCSFNKGTADATDFEANWKNSSTATSPGVQYVGALEQRTYSAEGALAGANNKDMLAIFNPAGSGKVIRIYEVWAAVPSSSGTTVIIPFEMHKTSTLTGGTVLTVRKWDSTDVDAIADVRTAPTGLTDAGVWYTFVEQINTAQGSTTAQTEQVHSGESTSELKPIILHPGEGLYLKQIANNTSTFRMGVLWTEV